MHLKNSRTDPHALQDADIIPLSRVRPDDVMCVDTVRSALGAVGLWSREAPTARPLLVKFPLGDKPPYDHEEPAQQRHPGATEPELGLIFIAGKRDTCHHLLQARVLAQSCDGVSLPKMKPNKEARKTWRFIKNDTVPRAPLIQPLQVTVKKLNTSSITSALLGDDTQEMKPSVKTRTEPASRFKYVRFISKKISVTTKHVQSPKTSAHLHLLPVGGTEEEADGTNVLTLTEAERRTGLIGCWETGGEVGWIILRYQALCSLWSPNVKTCES
ncbi:unnamed protein product [Pleuronectes platessa]|uniref:Uncharacterized protein n=1 Tax=Pleuronectes platessa TaxID=8262 RepID=A0A9N7YZ91_PLEPL|nr:unnamed protein product [Pleuronectes platessa]